MNETEIKEFLEILKKNHTLGKEFVRFIVQEIENDSLLRQKVKNIVNKMSGTTF